MNWVDYAIIGMLALSVLVGLWRGLITEVLALVIWVAAFWVAWTFGERVAAVFASSIELPWARLVLGYTLCFVGVLVVGSLLRFVLHKLIDGTGLSGSDRMLGMVFGLARGVLVVTLVVLLAGFTPMPGASWWQHSRVLPGFQEAAQWLGTRLPGQINQYISYAPKPVPAASPAKPPATVPGSLPKALPPQFVKPVVVVAEKLATAAAAAAPGAAPRAEAPAETRPASQPAAAASSH
ncbi:MAG TPA: CvpA family protein [Rhodanobacteraceae bacterium]|nr:CvpA family protein [Rhodanobacteraceae bacterium]